MCPPFSMGGTFFNVGMRKSGEPLRRTTRERAMTSADEIMERLGLVPLREEGGYFAETYKSDEVIPKDSLPERYPAERAFGTSIFYLLTPDTFSALHRLTSDEIFHFYLGDAVTMLQLHPDGSSKVVTLGQDIRGGQELQVVVPRGTWQGSFLNEGGEFALLGCTVAPGFEYEDYEGGSREELVERYPEARELIVRLSPGD